MSYPHPIENIIRTTMEEIKQMVDVNTVVGEPVFTSDGTMILPVSKVSLGFLSGGGEYSKGETIMRRNEDKEIVDDIRHPFAGTSAAGMSITPSAFLVVGGGSVKVMPAEYDCTIDRIIELIPRAIEEVNKLFERGVNCRKNHADHHTEHSEARYE